MARKMIEYESADYGIFLIQQEGKKWIIAWDPEQCCEWHSMDPSECEYIDDLLTYCIANPKNLSSEDFKDYPKNEFNSEEEAKQYIESKFGTIS
jgi:hypothetical protein